MKIGNDLAILPSHNRQGVIFRRKLEELKWCGCSKEERRKAVYLIEGKAQQSSTRTGALKGAAKERGSQREVRRTFKILREVWLNVGIEKIDTYKGVIVKVLLDSGATGMFMDRRTATKHSFRLQKLERPIAVRNVDRTNNSEGAIMS